MCVFAATEHHITKQVGNQCHGHYSSLCAFTLKGKSVLAIHFLSICFSGYHSALWTKHNPGTNTHLHIPVLPLQFKEWIPQVSQSRGGKIRWDKVKETTAELLWKEQWTQLSLMVQISTRYLHPIGLMLQVKKTHYTPLPYPHLLNCISTASGSFCLITKGNGTQLTCGLYFCYSLLTMPT